MYISVIPTTKSQGRIPYTYFVSKTWEAQIVVWWVVEIPFGKDIIIGVIVSIEGLPPWSIDVEDIRPIHAVLSSTSLLDASLLKIVSFLAERYFLPIHKSLALFLPAPLLHRLEKRNYILITPPNHLPEKKSSSVSIHHFINHIFSPNDLSAYLESGTVIIFPDDIMLFTFLESRKKEKNILIIPTEATSAKRVQAWIDIYEWKYEIIVWTRRLLYYNLTAYKNIIYVEDAFGALNFQYPITIRSLDVLTSLWLSHKHSLTIISSSPTLELFAKFPLAEIISIK